MSMSDPIADMLTRIRNAQASEKVIGGDAGEQAEGCDRQSAEGRRLHRRLRVRQDGGKPQLEIGLKYYAGPAGDREDRAREPSGAAYLQGQPRTSRRS